MLPSAMHPWAYPVPPMAPTNVAVPYRTWKNDAWCTDHAHSHMTSVFPPLEEVMALDPCVVRWTPPVVSGSPPREGDGDCDGDEELEALRVVVACLQDRYMNPHQGSVAMEKLMNLVQRHHPSIRPVIGTTSAQFRAFVDRHGSVLGATQGDVGANGGPIVRIFLQSNAHYYALRDAAKEASDRCLHAEMEEDLTAFLTHHLGGEDGASLDACVAAMRQPMHRGDLVRFLRSRPHRFDYDNRRYRVRMRR